MSTAQAIITAAFAKSAAARPELQASPAELLDRLHAGLREAWSLIAQRNPYALTVPDTLTFDATDPAGWPRPPGATAVVRLETTAETLFGGAAPPPGTVVRVVPFEDRLVAAGEPSVYEVAQRYVPVGQAVDPTGGKLRCWYIRPPIRPVSVLDALDPLYPSMYDEFLVADLALFLAKKDERAADVTVFAAEKSAQATLLTGWATAMTWGTVQRHPQATPPLTVDSAGAPQPRAGAE